MNHHDEFPEQRSRAVWAAKCNAVLSLWNGDQASRRYLTDHLARLPLCAAGRLLSASDAVMALASLLARPPWQRRRRGAGLQRFSDGGWSDVKASAEPCLCKAEAQVGPIVFQYQPSKPSRE